MRKALVWVVDRIKKEIRDQGHVASGRLLDSVRWEISVEGGVLIGRVYLLDYANILNTGVPAGRVPYSPGSGATTSAYIRGLIDWINTIRPGLAETEVKSWAFAMANTAIKTGHPLPGSYAYSQNGRRTGWAKAAIQDNRKTIINMLDFAHPVAALFANMVDRIKNISV